MIPLPWLILAVTLLVGAAGASGYWQGGKHKEAEIVAQQARDAVIGQEAQDKALAAAADRVVKLDVQNKTIHAKTEVIVREVTVYRDCKHSPDGLRNVNEALTGQAEPPADGQLPAADPAD
jgi:uncharacterized protein YbjQ (UPF0145 family)